MLMALSAPQPQIAVPGPNPKFDRNRRHRGTAHRSPLTAHRSPPTAHRSPLTAHRSPLLHLAIILSVELIAFAPPAMRAQDPVDPSTPGACVAAGSPCVPTYHYDKARSGVNPNEPTLTPTLLSSGNFGLLQNGSYQVDALVYAQPLYLSGVAMSASYVPPACSGTQNIVLVATENNTLYALTYSIAHNQAGLNAVTWTTCWQTPLNTATINGQSVTGTAIPFTDLPGSVPCNNIVPQSGITSTPVVDTSVTPPIVYIVTANKMPVSGTYQWNYYLHAVRVDEGVELTSSTAPYQIVFPNLTSGWNAKQENQRPGLALTKNPNSGNAQIYAAFASYCDDEPYSGYVTGVQMAYKGFAFSPIGSNPTVDTENGSTTSQGGIWMGGSAPAVDGNGNLYLAVGNGTFNVTGTASRASTYGESVIQITSNTGGTNSGLNIVDYYTLNDYAGLNLGGPTVCTTYEPSGTSCPTSPTDYQLNLGIGAGAGDLDLGSGGVTLITPSSGTPNMCGSNQQMVAGGKEGVIYDICASTQTTSAQQTVMGGLDSCGYSVSTSSACFKALATTEAQTACTQSTSLPTAGAIAQCFEGVNAGQNQAGSPPTILASPGIHGPEAFWAPGFVQTTGSTWNLLYVAGAGSTASPTPMEGYNMSTSNGMFGGIGDPDSFPRTYPWPGTVPVVSWKSQNNANGNNATNALLWALDVGGYGLWNAATMTSGAAKPAELIAYYALPQTVKGQTELEEIWESDTNSSNDGPGAVKFTVPTVANGLVFVGGGVQGYAPGPAGGSGVNCTGVTLTTSQTPAVCQGALYVYGQLQ